MSMQIKTSGTNSPNQLVPTLRAELVKVFTLRSWWIGIAVIIALNAFYAHVSGELLDDLSSTLHGDTFIDYSGKSASFTAAVHDALLAPPYQSMGLFFPLLIAIIAGHEYRSGQISLSTLAQPRRTQLVIAQALSTSAITALMTIVAILLSESILLVTLPSQAQPVLLSGSVFLIGMRLVVFTSVMSIFSHALTSLSRSAIPALIVLTVLLVIAMTGLLTPIGPWAQNLVPLSGAQSFVFGHPLTHSSLTSVQGLLLLGGWLLAGVTTWCFTFGKRDVT